jgi:hypothetical protein
LLREGAASFQCAGRFADEGIHLEGERMRGPWPGGARPVTEGWQALATGLQVQRVYLHLAEWRAACEPDAADLGLPEELAARALAARPLPCGPVVEPLLARAGLAAWVSVPQELGLDVASGSPLADAAAETALVLGDGLGDETRVAVEAACAAAAWWAGVFTLLHFVAGRTARVSLLRQAGALVALGAGTRVLGAELRRAGTGSPVLRAAYCRAVAEAVVAEPDVAPLLESLGGQRLPELVRTHVPWRGQFTQYQGGTGAGQVE